MYSKPLVNLTQVPIIYSCIDHVHQGDLLRFIKQYIHQPYILITGENDEGVPKATSNLGPVYQHLSESYGNLSQNVVF